MSTPKDRLEFPYKKTHSECCDQMIGTVQRLVLNDGPLKALTMVADGNAHGVAKHAKGDWRTRSQEYFLPKVLRHLRQHYGYDAYHQAKDEIDEWEWTYDADLPEYLDAESGVPHLAKAATNILMALENVGNKEDAPAEVKITPEELGMCYLAQPYTVKPGASYRAAIDISSEGIVDGVKLYSPIAFGHLVAPDAPYEYWLAHGLDMLRRCDSLVLVNDESLGPWQDSQGCVKEHALALELGKKCYQFNTAEWKLVRL